MRESGGHLASIHSLAEDSFISQLVDPSATGRHHGPDRRPCAGRFRVRTRGDLCLDRRIALGLSDWRPEHRRRSSTARRGGSPGKRRVLADDAWGPFRGLERLRRGRDLLSRSYYVCKFRPAPTPTHPRPHPPRSHGARHYDRAPDDHPAGARRRQCEGGHASPGRTAPARSLATGTATGTDLGDPSWLVRNLKLFEGQNQIRVVAWDNEGTAFPAGAARACSACRRPRS